MVSLLTPPADGCTAPTVVSTRSTTHRLLPRRRLTEKYAQDQIVLGIMGRIKAEIAADLCSGKQYKTVQA